MSSARGCGERRHRRPFSRNLLEIRFHRLDRRLLQHDFRQPDMVRIGPDACGKSRRRNAPGQVAMVGVVPAEQAGRRCRPVRSTFPCGLWRWVPLVLKLAYAAARIWQDRRTHMAGKRSDRNPVAVSDLATEILDPVLRKRAGISIGLVQSWEEIAGPRLAEHSRPEKIQWPRRMREDDPFEPAVLVVACEGAAALHLQHETGEIIGRVNAFLGFSAIGRIRIVQKPLTRQAREAEATSARPVAGRKGPARRNGGQDRGRRPARFAGAAGGDHSSARASRKPEFRLSLLRDRGHGFCRLDWGPGCPNSRQLSLSGASALQDPSIVR